jgi:uncharacterized protein YbaA (DUF1428 family)
MSYVEGFVAAVPTANREDYRIHASKAAELFRRFGAIRVVECWGDDVPKGEVTDFYRAVQAKDDETIVFSWTEWPDKTARDTGMKQIFEEMPELMKDYPMPFDGKRLIFGGFEPIVDDCGKA